MSKAKILLAEDDIYSAKLVCDFLSAHGYNVICFRDGLTVLKEADNTRFDIALLDLRLPAKNGFLVAEQLRKNYSNAAIPIIIISAFTDQQNKLRAYEAGANYFLSKPINTKELLLIIENLLKHQQQRTTLIQSNINKLIEIQLGRKEHTDKVILHCKNFAQLQGIVNEDNNILLTAAAFHDIGLINTKDQEGHVETSMKIAEEMGLSKDIVTLIKFHHHISKSDFNKLPAHLMPLVKIIQTAEKIEEVYCYSSDDFQEDLKKGFIQPLFVSYISNYI